MTAWLGAVLGGAAGTGSALLIARAVGIDDSVADYGLPYQLLLGRRMARSSPRVRSRSPDNQAGPGPYRVADPLCAVSTSRAPGSRKYRLRPRLAQHMGVACRIDALSDSASRSARDRDPPRGSVGAAARRPVARTCSGAALVHHEQLGPGRHPDASSAISGEDPHEEKAGRRPAKRGDEARIRPHCYPPADTFRPSSTLSGPQIRVVSGGAC